LSDGASTTSQVQVMAPGTLIWSDASTDAITPGVTKILSAYSGASPTFDTTTLVWLVMAIKGKTPLLMHEADFPANVETVLASATWALLGRIEGAELSAYPAV
jgi:hypothetical protein